MPAPRLAEATDLGLVQEITDAAYTHWIPLLGGPPLPMTEDYVPRIAAHQVWLVSEAGADIGVAVLETEPDHLMIFSLSVRPEAHGRGIGQWMIAFAADKTRAAGLPEMRLYTNPLMARNIEIYRRNGFTETGRRPNPRRPGWLFVDMAKRV